MKLSLIAAVLWLMIPSLLAADQDSSKIIAMENLWNRAELNNDAPAVRLLLADDFVMTVAEGTLYNKAQMSPRWPTSPTAPKFCNPLTWWFIPMANTAVVTGAYYEKGVDKGQALGAPRPLHRHLDEPRREDGSASPATSAYRQGNCEVRCNQIAVTMKQR